MVDAAEDVDVTNHGPHTTATTIPDEWQQFSVHRMVGKRSLCSSEGPFISDE